MTTDVPLVTAFVAEDASFASPFLLAAVFLAAPGVLRGINRRLRFVNTMSEAVMLGVGVVMLLGIYERLFAEVTRVAPWTPWKPIL